MRTCFRNLAAMALLALGLCACQKEPPVQEFVQPAKFAELVKAYEEGMVFSEAKVTGDMVSLIFSGGFRLDIVQTYFRIYDCSVAGPSEVVLSADKDSWLVGGHPCGVPYTPGLASSEAFPVYVYYDKVTLHVHVSNGEILKFKSRVSEAVRRQNIPVVRISTDGQAPILDKKNYVQGTISISDPEKLYSDVAEFSVPMGIRGRGNSTWGFPKKPWKFKLKTAAPVLGMPADKEWCLLANYADRTLLRNIVSMKLSEMCGFSWTPRMRSVEVYLNDKYQGVYTLAEHKKISAGRVDISIAGENDNSGDALTGGYYLEIEQQQDETTCWWTAMGVPMMLRDPEVPAPEQLDYIKGFFHDFETALYSSDFADSEKGYAKYIDVDSFIDYFIVQELTKNIDGNLRKSSFITKERGRKMEMYHLWDFDLTLGNCGYFPWEVGNGPENFWIRDYNPSSDKGDNWYNRMLRDPAFVRRLQERWKELMPQFETIPAFIDDEVAALQKAVKRNFEVWDINESVDWVMFPSRGSYEKEISFLKDFYLKRLAWLDKNISMM